MGLNLADLSRSQPVLTVNSTCPPRSESTTLEQINFVLDNQAIFLPFIFLQGKLAHKHPTRAVGGGLMK